MATVVDVADIGEVEVFDPPASRRPFAPGDVLRLLVGIGLILVGVVVARVVQSTVRGIESDLTNVFAKLPSELGSLLLSVAELATSLVPITVFVVLLVRRRWKVALLLLLTGILADIVMTAINIFVIDSTLAAELARQSADESVHDATYPSSYVLASTTAVVAAAAPWLSRRWRRVMWWGVGILVVLRLLAVAHPAFDVVLALGVGIAVGSLVLLVFGSPNREPAAGELVVALRRLGLRPRRVERLDPVGPVLHYRVTEADGDRSFISLRTPDERDADLLDRTYRGLRFRASEVDVGYATLKRRIEHEALVLTLAERGRVRVPSVRHVGTTARGSAFLVTREMPVRPVTEVDLHSTDVVRSLWAQLLQLHQAGLAHRRLTLAAISLDEHGQVWLSDFDGAQTAPSDRDSARDVAELLTETALVIGPVEAVAVAVAVMGPERVAPSLRMLQPLALPTSTRKRAKAVPGLLDDLRREVNQATGEPGLQLEQLERLKPRTVLIIGASSLAFYSLLPQLTNLSSTFKAFGHAEAAWIAATLVASALTYLFAAVAFQGAVADPLPFAPDVRVQVASSFTTLVGPAGAGGFALKGRFLQRVGVGGPEAAASVAVSAIAGFAVHITLLIGFILWTGQSGVGGFSLPDSTTVLLVLAIVLALIGVLVAVGPTRQRVMVPAWRAIKTGLVQIVQVFRRPLRVAALFGGSAALTLTYVAAMACAIQAYGGGLSFPQIGAAYLVAVALATLAPTPGGLGALESALIAGFTGYGLPDGIAVSAVLTFRLATFWLPILPGWATMQWMQRNDEV